MTKLRERAEKLFEIIMLKDNDGVECKIIETALREYGDERENEGLEKVYQIAKDDELELISAKQILALKTKE
jgi:hypothetical protein